MHNASAVSDHSSIRCIKYEKWKEVNLPLGCIWRNWESSTEPLVWHLFPSTASTITSTYNHTFPYFCDHYIPFERKKRMSTVPCSIFHQIGLWASNSQKSSHTIQQCLTLSITSQIFRLQKPDQRRLQLLLSFAQGSSIPAIRLQRWYNFILAIKLLFLSINEMICEQEPLVTASTEGRIVIITPLEECHRQELEFDHESPHPVKHLPWSEYKTPHSSKT